MQEFCFCYLGNDVGYCARFAEELQHAAFVYKALNKTSLPICTDLGSF